MEANSDIAQLDTGVGASSGADTSAKLYAEAVAAHGQALIRMARGYESDPERRNDLLQDIHVALWRSFAIFDGRCSLLTWVYRVAHITATKHIVSNRRVRLNELQTLDDLPEVPAIADPITDLDHESSTQRLLELIQKLQPLERQIILLYLEDISADGIGEIVGLSPANVATKIHRIKKLLTSMFHSRQTR